MRRLIRVYLWHVGLVASVVLTGLVVSRIVSHRGPGDYLRPFRVFGMGGFVEDPTKFLAKALTLSSLPSYLDILPLYVLLLAVLPLLASAVRRSRVKTLCASTAVWFVSRILDLNMANTAARSGEWFFNPFSWQLVFVIGVVFGHVLKTRGKLDFGSSGLFRLALVVVLISIPLNIVYHAMKWDDLVLADPNVYSELIIMKGTGGLLRVINAAALVYVLWNWKMFETWSGAARAAPLVRAGRHSLPVFVLGLVITYALKVTWIINGDIGHPAQIVIGLLGCALLLVFATSLERRRLSTVARRRETTAFGTSVQPYLRTGRLEPASV